MVANSAVSAIIFITSLLFGLVILDPVPLAEAAVPDLATVKVEKELDLPTRGTVVAVAWSPDGSSLAAVSNYSSVFTVWDQKGHLINEFERNGAELALGGSLSFIDGSSKLLFQPPSGADSGIALSIWDIKSGKTLREITGPNPGEESARNRARYFSISTDQKVLAFSTRFGGDLTIMQTSDWRPFHVSKIKDGIDSLSILDGAKAVVTGSRSGRVSVIPISTEIAPETLQVYDESNFGNISIGAAVGSPDGQFLFAGVGSADLTTVSQSSEVVDWQNSIKPAKVYRLRDKTLIASFTDARPVIRHAVWDPDNRFIAFIDNTPTLYLWQPQPPGSYKKISLPSTSMSLALSPDGHHLAVAGDGGVTVFTIANR